MERIGKIGWFLNDEEFERISNAIIVIQEVLDSVKVNAGSEPGDLTLKPGQGNGTLPLNPCPNCPWKGNEINPWVNPADWTWRPWQAPWYGDPGEIKRFEVGDGEWWKHQPYCTSTIEDNPNVVKETKSNIDPDFINKLRNFAKADPNPTRE